MNIHRNSTKLRMTSICTDLQTKANEPDDCEFSEDPTKENPDTGETFSVFGEGACGEPQSAQHLVIDFTHNELDSDFVQKKCCTFWEFIDNHPEIHHMMVLPDSQMYHSTPTSTENSIHTEDVFSEKIEDEPVLKEHTAVSMLDFVSREGLIDKSFEVKIPQTFCSLGSREYIENEVIQHQPKATKKKGKDPALCYCPLDRKCCSMVKASEVAPASSEVKAMCESMKQWDLHHPKSMEPPGHAVPLIHSVMQRKPF